MSSGLTCNGLRILQPIVFHGFDFLLGKVFCREVFRTEKNPNHRFAKAAFRPPGRFALTRKRLGVLRPVAAFYAWTTCRPSSTAFSGAPEYLRLRLRKLWRVMGKGLRPVVTGDRSPRGKGGDKSPHSKVKPAAGWFGVNSAFRLHGSR